MKKTFVLAAVIALCNACFSCPALAGGAETAAPQKQADDRAEIRKLFADYAQLMNAEDADSIAAKIYDVPVIYHQPDGQHTVYTDQASLAQVWKRYIDTIESKHGAVKLDITEIAPCFLNQNTAVVTSKSVRTVLKDNSTELSGWLYIVGRKNGQWKISEISARDLDKPLSCP